MKPDFRHIFDPKVKTGIFRIDRYVVGVVIIGFQIEIIRQIST